MTNLPPPGQLVADVDGARVQCHVCGGWYPMLGVHVARKHGMTGDEYREEFGLNRTTRLCSPALRAKYSVLFGERITSVQLAVNPLLNAPPERIALGRHRPQRLQSRKHLSARQHEFQSTHARPKERRPSPPAPERTAGLQAGPRRLAELHKDPAWRAEWLLRVRRASALTDEQILYVRARAGHETRGALAGQLGVSADTISKVWRGDLRPLRELLAEAGSASAD